MTWWWLSFYAKEGGSFQGVLLVEARCLPEALQVATQLGGQGFVRAQPMSREECDLFYIPEDHKYCLLTEAQAKSLDALWGHFMRSDPGLT